MNGVINRNTKLLIAIAALLLGLTFLFPLWNIEIAAPQYPEGLYMQIWTSKLTGDIRNINIINHYIGMKAIEAKDFPELQYFPMIMGFFLVTGLGVAAIGRRTPLYVWAGLLLVFAVLAFVDFYVWEYKFGHELSEDAAIKMEGMTYSPPLIGKKELLNITTWSLPAVGGIGFALSVLLTVLGCYLDIRTWRSSGPKVGRKAGGAAVAALSIGAMMALNGCDSNTPTAIELGKDACDQCRMTILDARFGGEVVMRKGKVHMFDSLDCLVRFYLQNREQVGKIWVRDFARKGDLIEAETAKYAEVSQIRGPMGHAILASSDSKSFSVFGENLEIFKWNEVLTKLSVSSS